MRRHQLLCRCDVEALGEDRAERLDLHLAKARQRGQVRAQRRGIAGSGPDTAGVAVVLIADVDCEVVHAASHRAGKAMDRGPLAEYRLEIGVRERGRL